MPMVGEIQAQGLTPQQVQDAIAKRLGEFLKDPQVSVELQDVRSKKYFLLGAIDRPGEYRFALAINVLEALSNGGRFQDFARLNKIVVLRGDKKFVFNYKDVSRGKKLAQNIVIEDGDKIIVPE
jgi:polysaccharide export outer membrane protein